MVSIGLGIEEAPGISQLSSRYNTPQSAIRFLSFKTQSATKYAFDWPKIELRQAMTAKQSHLRCSLQKCHPIHEHSVTLGSTNQSASWSSSELSVSHSNYSGGGAGHHGYRGYRGYLGYRTRKCHWSSGPPPSRQSTRISSTPCKLGIYFVQLHFGVILSIS